MTIIAGIVGALAVVVAAARWLRVLQREHYIASSGLVVARRWIVCRPHNALLAAIAILGAIGAITTRASIAAPCALAAATAGGAFPIPMTVLGHDTRLRMTRRATTLTAVVAALALAVIALTAAFGRWYAGPALAAVAMVVLVDATAAITAPFERRAMERHRDRAAAKLRTIAPTVIAVTGSWGKTSTKQHIADLLNGSVTALASPASFNNTGGLSRTINDHMSPGCEVFVAEMGMYGPGEIRALCAWIPPDIGVICAVGPMHLERAGSIEAILAAKAEILERASQAVLWVSNPLLADLAEQQTIKVWRVGTAGTPDLDVEIRDNEHGDAFEVVHDGRVLGTCSKDSGVHPENVGCAVAATLAYGIDEQALASRLAHLTSPDHRATTARSDTGVFVIDDTFNSNPQGANRAMQSLVRAVPDGRRAVVTPGMVELGRTQADENRRFASDVTASGSTLVIVGYTNRRALLAGASEGSGSNTNDGTVVRVRDRDAARTWVRATLRAGDGVLWENDLPDHYP